VDSILGSMLPDCRDPRWYVLFVRTNQEKRVAESLAARAVEHYLPCYSSIRKWKDRRISLEMPLFPGYIFVRLPLFDKRIVLTVPNIVSLVGSSRGASEMTEEEIQSIKRGLEHGTAQPHPYLKEGERVMITTGIMAGMEGVLLRRQNGARIVICLDSILRAFVVEVDESSVQRVAVRGPFLAAGSAPSLSMTTN
jgi:transcription termination/antitermination protein NusG